MLGGCGWRSIRVGKRVVVAVVVVVVVVFVVVVGFDDVASLEDGGDERRREAEGHRARGVRDRAELTRRR